MTILNDGINVMKAPVVPDPDPEPDPDPPADPEPDPDPPCDEETEVTPELPEFDRPPGNASTEIWAEYADRLGVQVPEDATRTEIIAAVDAAASSTDEETS